MPDSDTEMQKSATAWCLWGAVCVKILNVIYRHFGINLVNVTGNLVNVTVNLTNVTVNLTNVTGNLVNVTRYLANVTGNIANVTRI